MIMEMHVWPYANAAVAVSVISIDGDFGHAFVRGLLTTVDEKVIAAEAAQ